MRELFEKLEAAVVRRNPALAARLRPGLTEYRIRKLLEEGNVQGALEPIVALFSWKNGTLPNVGPAQARSSLFPGTDYMLPELNFMVSDFRGFEEISMYHPAYTEVINRYFPLFWDGSGFLAVDLEPAGGSQIVIIERKAKKLICQAYPSFENFLQNAIRANENNEPLSWSPADSLPGAPEPRPALKLENARRIQ